MMNSKKKKMHALVCGLRYALSGSARLVHVLDCWCEVLTGSNYGDLLVSVLLP